LTNEGTDDFNHRYWSTRFEQQRQQIGESLDAVNPPC
jgi:hypothetical protein